jgi:hypothetical protein
MAKGLVDVQTVGIAVVLPALAESVQTNIKLRYQALAMVFRTKVCKKFDIYIYICIYYIYNIILK